MKRWFNRLHCLGKGDTVLPHCLDQCLGNTRCQVQHLFHCFSLNQETRESRAGGKVAAFLKRIDFNWQFVPYHIADIIARRGF